MTQGGIRAPKDLNRSTVLQADEAIEHIGRAWSIAACQEIDAGDSGSEWSRGRGISVGGAVGVSVGMRVDVGGAITVAVGTSVGGRGAVLVNATRGTAEGGRSGGSGPGTEERIPGEGEHHQPGKAEDAECKRSCAAGAALAAAISTGGGSGGLEDIEVVASDLKAGTVVNGLADLKGLREVG